MIHRLYATQLKTPLGIMLAIADEGHLLFLDFVNREMITHWNQKMIGSGNNLGPWEVEEDRWDCNSPAALLSEEPFSFFKFERKLKKILCEHSLTRIFHQSRDEEAAKADGTRQAPNLNDGCIYPYSPSPSSSLTQYPWAFPASAVERDEISGLKLQPGSSTSLHSIQRELEKYFSGRLDCFKTPYRMLGSNFQQATWKRLLEIPYATTISYAEEAMSLGKPTAIRAVANANGANLLAIVIPCHRVIATDGKLGGYGSGLRRKEWLLQHEKNHHIPFTNEF